MTPKEDVVRKERLVKASMVQSKETTSLTANHLASKSFAHVFRSRLQKAGDFAKIEAKEGEVMDKLGQLKCCLVGWW